MSFQVTNEEGLSSGLSSGERREGMLGKKKKKVKKADSNQYSQQNLIGENVTGQPKGSNK